MVRGSGLAPLDVTCLPGRRERSRASASESRRSEALGCPSAPKTKTQVPSPETFGRADGGSDLPDQSVVQCVVRGFGNLSFPQPEGGMVTVVYPIMFNPGD